MKTRYYITILIVIITGLFIFYTFRSYKHKSKEFIPMNNTRPIEELKKLVISKGDTIAYYELSIAYLNVDYYKQEYLLYSIVMADKYNYPRAYYDVYHGLTSIFERHHYAGKIDEKTKNLAMMFLKGGAKLNDKQSTHELSELYLQGKYVPKDTIFGKKLAEKEKSCW